MSADTTIFAVDGDLATRDAVRAIVETMDLRCRTYETGRAFLEDYDGSQAGCLVTETLIQDMDGLELQRWLATQSHALPVIFLTAHASVALAARAMHQGAISFLEKPLQEHELRDAVQKAVRVDRQGREMLAERQRLKDQLARLTPGEQDVLNLLVQDKTTKTVARELGVSVRTVESRKAAVLRKLHIKTPLGLVYFAIRLFDGNGEHPARCSDAARDLGPLGQHAEIVQRRPTKWTSTPHIIRAIEAGNRC
jgi:two-component system response regulator FixJ